MTPDETARTAAAKHRKEIEDWLTSDLGIIRMRETGSWHHGTALAAYSDVDYFVSMPGNRPSSSSAALETLRSSLLRGMQGVVVSIDRPAVRLRYFDGGPDVEITPAYYQDTDDYDIPDPVGAGWIRSNPAVHLEYVNRAQKATGGRAKGLIRLVKIWKFRDNVPISSFYLEMRTAQYALGNTSIVYERNLREFFNAPDVRELREMNDPTNYGRRISRGAGNIEASLAASFAVSEAARLSTLAREAAEVDNHSAAIRHLRTLFNWEI